MNHHRLDHFTASLRLPRRRRNAIERELHAHLQESQRDLELAGWEPSAAARESLARLGDPDDIAQEFRRVYQPARQRRILLALGLAGCLFAGVYGASGTLASATTTHHSQSHYGRAPGHTEHYARRNLKSWTQHLSHCRP